VSGHGVRYVCETHVSLLVRRDSSRHNGFLAFSQKWVVMERVASIVADRNVCREGEFAEAGVGVIPEVVEIWLSGTLLCFTSTLFLHLQNDDDSKSDEESSST
jgi:hypothetical protein